MIPAMRIHQRVRQSGCLHLIDAWLPALLLALGRFPWRITALTLRERFRVVGPDTVDVPRRVPVAHGVDTRRSAHEERSGAPASPRTALARATVGSDRDAHRV